MWRMRPSKVVLLTVLTAGIFIVRFSPPLRMRKHVRSVLGSINTIINNENPQLETVKLNLAGKTRVFRHNGATLNRLYEFCTWTLPFNRSMLTTPARPVPIFIHNVEADQQLSARIVRDGQRDPLEITPVLRELKKTPEAQFVDIGANIGIFTLTVATNLNRPVLSVEPVMENIVRLCKSVQENGLTENVTLVFNPLSDTNGFVEMNKFLNRPTRYRIEAPTNRVQNGGRLSFTRRLSTRTARLDDLLPLMTFKTAVLKVDVESYESHVINGGQRFLDEIHVPAIYMEWGHAKRRPEVHRLLEFMKEKGYNAYHPHEDPLNAPLNFEAFETWPFNIIWIKQ